ncbi:PREDICTED: uncharacterized protein LOC104009153 [Nipponia nippon]|uniref:uncharacterized protein LOC104009153 n=1 Tax=Nipponia nippon TaxID=128390 RepID=UPI000510C4AD|nr:PREDICTED: uncharacterized protein LOC104009153 [Nipponia nippon]
MAVNPATFLNAENPEESLVHDCIQTIEQVYSSRPDLKSEPLINPDLEMFTDGSSYVIDGQWKAGYTVVTPTQVLEAKALPVSTSAQKGELIALTRALDLSQGKKVNIWTDSKYAFGVIHAHGAIWKERELLSAQGMPIKHSEEILQLLKSVQKPAEVAVMHCKAHQSGRSPVIDGNRLADKAAKEAVEQGIFVVMPKKKISLPDEGPKYGSADKQLADLLKAVPNEKGWMITPNYQVVVTPDIMTEIMKREHQQTHWGIESLVQGLQKVAVSVGMIKIAKSIVDKSVRFVKEITLALLENLSWDLYPREIHQEITGKLISQSCQNKQASDIY